MSFIRNKCFNASLLKSFSKSIARNQVKVISTSKSLCDTPNSGESIKTSLYDFHVKHGGKMVDFAGHLLPVQYFSLSVSESHLHTRSSVSLFDVSHMLQTMVSGKDCVEWFETLCPVDLKGLPDGSSALTVFLNDHGGILDDLIVTKVDSENLYVVSNAGRMEHDKEHMSKSLNKFKKANKSVNIKFFDVTERSLVALQGPKAATTLQALCQEDISSIYFMKSKEMTVAGVEGCRVTRCGYTGEDGFEISMPAEEAIHICEALMRLPSVKLAGLGARDSLRLEAGLCLYGNDIYDGVTPIEANLAWLIQKRRRIDSNFQGAEVILKQLRDGVSKRRVGLRMEAGPPARRGAHIRVPLDTEIIGLVTSGCPSPSLGVNIAMAYVKEELKQAGTELVVNIRNRDVSCKVVKMPFTPANYYTKK